jgi:drug/metabolite transporter (DMT)-like permease
MRGDNLKNYLHLHFIVFIWGFTAVLGALITLDALPLVWFRMCIAVGIILLYLYIKKIPAKVPRKTLIGFLFAGLVIAVHWLTFFKAIKVSNVSITLACMSTGAFFASLLESVLYGKKVVWYELLMGFIVMIALIIILYGDFFMPLLSGIIQDPSSFGKIVSSMPPAEPGRYWGIALALASAFLSALFALINSKYSTQYNPSVISFWELLGGVLFFSVYLLFSGSFTAEFFAVSASDWIWLFALGSFCTAYAFIASVQVLKYLSPYTVMLTINMEPVYGIILAVIVFSEKEKMSLAFYIGAGIILTTVILNGILKNYTKVESK